MLQQVKQFLELSEAQLKEDVILKRKENVSYLVLNKKGNSFTKDFLRAIFKKLDEITFNPQPTTLVTVSTGKIFSGGLDINYMSKMGPEDGQYFVLELIKLYGRMLSFNCPTMCLVKGAAFAGGCMLAFSHDEIHVYGQSLFCCNEVQLGLSLPPGMSAVIRRRMDSLKDYRDMVIYAKKFKAEEGLKKGFVDSIILNNGMQQIHKIAQAKSIYSKDRGIFKKLKEEMNKEAIDCCFNKQHAVGVRGDTNPAEGTMSKL